jgi:hypothetical protein
MTYWHYYSINAQLLVWPYPLCCDWSMGAVAVVSSWSPHVPSVGGGLLMCPFVSVVSSCALFLLALLCLLMCPLLACPLVSLASGCGGSLGAGEPRAVR